MHYLTILLFYRHSCYVAPDEVVQFWYHLLEEFTEMGRLPLTKGEQGFIDYFQKVRLAKNTFF